ncbi:Protease do-like, partial [Thalictrum thalictroides]
SDDAENIGYVIPTTVVSHFLNDYEKNRRYTGFPSLGVLLQKLENPALRECLKVQSNEGVLVRRIEPTSDAHNVLKE